jgi:branched-chain amino acid transport system ATP-binding protein
MSDALRLDGIQKNFGALQVASDISLSLPVGARTALIGPYGAGKTTFVNIVTGALAPSSGTIRYFGQDITAASQAERARAGLLRTFQITRVFKTLTVADNVRLAVVQQRGQQRSAWRSADRDEIGEAKVASTLALLQLQHIADRRVDRLAYGERRLVEIALALAGEPKVLLLDEPAAGVPKGESETIMRAVESLPSDLAILLVEHDMDLVFRFAREIVVLVAGAILTTGSPDQISRDPRVRDIYFGHRHARR